MSQQVHSQQSTASDCTLSAVPFIVIVPADPTVTVRANPSKVAIRIARDIGLCWGSVFWRFLDTDIIGLIGRHGVAKDRNHSIGTGSEIPYGTVELAGSGLQNRSLWPSRRATQLPVTVAFVDRIAVLRFGDDLGDIIDAVESLDEEQLLARIQERSKSSWNGRRACAQHPIRGYIFA